MSNKTKLFSAIMSAIADCSISHLTREAYERTGKEFVNFVYEEGYVHVVAVTDISGKHLRAYIAKRKDIDGLAIGSLQNEASHLRGIIRARGRVAVATAPELANPSLHIDGRSRAGTKTAISDLDMARFHERALRLGRPGMSALLAIERQLGLRGNEAIHARPDTLTRWEHELLAAGKIRVFAGVKGNRERDVRIHAIEDALVAVRAAGELAAVQRGFLVVRKDGSPSRGLKQARSIYHGFCARAGIQPHAARYAFARAQLSAYQIQGYSEREARILVSHDLGHGDRRGRWVKSVYGR